MEIDIDALISARKLEQENRVREQEQFERERSEARMRRRKERDEIYEREFRRQATLVSACVTLEYSPTRLHEWFLLDHWAIQDGLVLLSGFDPKHIPFDADGNISIPNESEYDKRRNLKIDQIRRLDGLPLYRAVTEQVIGRARVTTIDCEFRFLHRRILEIWNSGSHTEDRYPPKYFIDWAIRKRLPVPWLEWAKTHNYYDDPRSNLRDTTPAANDSNAVSPKSETAFLHIIGALCDLYWNAAHPDQEYSQSALLGELKKYDGFHGMSERNLKDKLTKAMRAIRA